MGSEMCIRDRGEALTAAKHELEMRLAATSARLAAADSELRAARDDAAALRAETATLRTATRRGESEAHAAALELSALTQAVDDRDEIVAKTSALLDAALDAKRTAEASLGETRARLDKAEAKLEHAVNEIGKGNEIIERLQADARASRAKAKLRAAAAAKAESAAAEGRRALDAAALDAERQLSLIHI